MRDATEVPDCSLSSCWPSQGRAEIGGSGAHAGDAVHRCYCICVSVGDGLTLLTYTHTYQQHDVDSKEDRTKMLNSPHT